MSISADASGRALRVALARVEAMKDQYPRRLQEMWMWLNSIRPRRGGRQRDAENLARLTTYDQQLTRLHQMRILMGVGVSMQAAMRAAGF